MSLKNEAIDMLLKKIKKLKIRRVGEDLDEPATLKDLERVFDTQDWHQFLNIKNGRRAVFQEDSDYYLVVTFKK